MTFLKSEKFHSVALLTVISAFVYLPLATKLGYSHDDWYLMYAAKVKGITIFHTIFSGDRPLRAFVMMPAYWFFGENPLYYNFASFFFKLISGISFLWALRLVWAKEKLPTFLMALCFLVYPGFLSHPNGVDYLSHQVALAFASLSIGLSLKAILTEKRQKKVLFYILSVLLGGIYLGLMEYYIGIEALRFMLMFVVLWRKEGKWLQKIWRIIGQSVPFLLASFPFLFWRLFLFESERGATDTTQQFSGFLSSPLGFLRLWGIRLGEDFFKTLFGAWTIPFSQFYAKDARWLNVMGFSLVLGLLAFGMGYFLYERFFAKKTIQQDKDTAWQKEALIVGVVSLAASLVPVVMVNRQVSFPHYSRYTLPGSFSAVMILVTVIFFVRLKFFKETLFAFLLIIAGMTHFANAQKFADETASMNDFWWQVSWRVPHLSERTTLMVNYPVVSTEEDYFIWGPANQIYYPEGTSEDKVIPGVYAYILNDENIEKVIARERQEYELRRGTETYPNARNVLILSQPTINSCVQVIDGFAPEYSPFENPKVMQIGEFSEAEHILADAPFHMPPEVVFGPEPAHDWCYFYQKATLARQRGDWDEVYAIDTEASQQGSVPYDPVEWIPFIQASAMLGDGERVQEISSYIENNFVMQQVCNILSGMELTLEICALTE